MSTPRRTSKKVKDANICPDCGKPLFLHFLNTRCRDEDKPLERRLPRRKSRTKQ